jgi:hypothetical protein
MNAGRHRALSWHAAAIGGGAVALDKAALFEFVEHSGNIRRPTDKAAGKFERAGGVRMFGAQQAKQVVPLRRQVEARE